MAATNAQTHMRTGDTEEQKFGVITGANITDFSFRKAFCGLGRWVGKVLLNMLASNPSTTTRCGGTCLEFQHLQGGGWRIRRLHSLEFPPMKSWIIYILLKASFLSPSVIILESMHANTWTEAHSSLLFIFIYKKDKTWNCSKYFFLFCYRGVTAPSHRGKNCIHIDLFEGPG